MASPYDEEMVSKNFLPLRIDQLTPLMIKTATEELNENENDRFSSIQQLRKLITKEKRLRCRTDDEFLLQFLRAMKFDARKAFARLQSLCKVARESFSDLFADIDDERAAKAFGSGFGSHLPYRDREGAAVALIKMGNWKLEDHDAYSILNCCTAVALSAVDYPATQVCGLQVLVDVGGTTLQHVRCLGPRFLYLLARGLKDTLPIRFKGVHLINASSTFRYLWSIINFFLSEKMKKRVHFHDENWENLHKFIPKEILPTEYGGDNPGFDPVEQGSAVLEEFLPKYLQFIRSGYVKN